MDREAAGNEYYFYNFARHTFFKPYRFILVQISYSKTMKKNILLYFIAAFCFIGTYSNSQNINLSNSIFWDGECNLVANPKNPNHLVAAWIYFSLTNGKNTIATRSSFDGGKTWSPLQMQPHLWPKFTCADPTMYFGKDSCVYLAFIDLSGLHSSDSGNIMVTRSTNGGIT